MAILTHFTGDQSFKNLCR